MNSLQTNTHTMFLIGAYIDGDFWCRGEFYDREKAQEAFESYVKEQPGREVQLIQRIVMHAVIDTHYPAK